MANYYPNEDHNKSPYDQAQPAYGQQGQQPPVQQADDNPFDFVPRYMPGGQPRNEEIPQSDKFMTSLCKCGGPCTEACCCYWCQLSRQYNIIFNDTKGLHCGMCCVLATFDWCICAASSMACQCYLRDRLRKRYNMKEDCCTDCCNVFWCPCCALSQTHWEMALRGDDPGATCTSCGDADVATQMR